MKTIRVYRILNNSIRTGYCSITEDGKVEVYPNEAFGVVHVCTTLESLTEWIIALGASDGTPWYVDDMENILIGISELPSNLLVNVVKGAKNLEEGEFLKSIELGSLSEETGLVDVRINQEVEFTPFWIDPTEGYIFQEIQVACMGYEDWEYVNEDFGTEYTIKDIVFNEATTESIYESAPVLRLPLSTPMWTTTGKNLDNWTPVVNLFGEEKSNDKSLPNIGYYIESSFGSTLKGRDIANMIKTIIEPSGFIIESENFGDMEPSYNRRRFSPDNDWKEYSKIPLADARKLFWDWVKGYDERLLSEILDEIFPDGY